MKRLIVPPVAFKNEISDQALAVVWRLALESLWRATEVHVVGVSLAGSDVVLRWLLSKGAESPSRQRVCQAAISRIVVVNPNEDHRKNAIRLLATNEETKRVELTDLDEYTSWLKNDESSLS